MRNSAASIDEVCARHGCVQKVANGTAISSVDAYCTVTIFTESSVPVRQTLSAAISSIREGFEVEEVYVRLGNEDGLFYPLCNTHFAHFGEWIVIARRRHPSHDPRIVGIMLAKDEADVIPEVMAPLFPALSGLYFYAVDQETRDAVVANCPDGKAHFSPAPPEGVRDGYRQTLLEAARADAKDDQRPLWVMGIQGDEVFDDDLLHHVRLAQMERATAMNAQVPTFVLHESQREGWDWTLPLARRFTHYVWGGNEHAGFVDFPWVHYCAEEHMRAHPHGLYPGKWAGARPVRKHYPFRNPDQARARIADRVKSGWQPNYVHYAGSNDVFVKEHAYGLPVRRYWNWFGEAERVEGIW